MDADVGWTLIQWVQLLTALIVSIASAYLAYQANRIARVQSEMAARSVELTEMQLNPRFRARAIEGHDEFGFPFEVIEVYNDGGHISGLGLMTRDFLSTLKSNVNSEASIGPANRWMDVHYFHPESTGRSDGLVAVLEAYERAGDDSNFVRKTSRNHTLYAAELDQELPSRQLHLVSYLEMQYDAWNGRHVRIFRVNREEIGSWWSFSAAATLELLTDDEVNVLRSCGMWGDRPLGGFRSDELDKTGICPEWRAPGSNPLGNSITNSGYREWMASLEASRD